MLARRGVVAAAQQPVHDGGEGGLELLVGHHVDDGVQGRVEVACDFETFVTVVVTRRKK